MAVEYVYGAFWPILFSVAGIYLFSRSRIGELKPYGLFVIESVLLQIPLAALLGIWIFSGSVNLTFFQFP